MIQFQKVTKTFPSGFTALSGINFEVSPGEFCFIVGPSGAGKTTLFRLLRAEVEPSSGEVLFEKENVAKLSRKKRVELRRKVGMAFQDLKLLRDRTVFENVALTLGVLGYKNKEINKEVERVLELVDLKNVEDLFPLQLSGGELQRVVIARAVVGRPKVLLADEPTGDLDRETGWEVIKLLGRINDEGTTVLAATHNVEIVNRLKKRVIHLEKGRVVRDVKTGGYS